ncbi:uncharacterized protein LOC127734586 isoform X2 [Mytilus californianus]|uniref:uncharacterized protein LOC127734586 isoform X2 n=1 Tax=Mytilus californianus TaxID=6549 RepID=UPI00224820B8|nr:uncharacterized protein LOC127734586 isoform X2 [Mytilus californianus]
MLSVLCCSIEIKPTLLFGEDVNITATVSEVTHAIGRRWTRSELNAERHHEYDLMYDGLHVDSDFEDKFTELIGSDVFTLTIHNLTDTDVNKTYKLYFGFDTCEVNLTFVHVLVLTNNGALCYSLEIKPTPLFGEDVNITANVSEVTHDIGRRWTRSDFKNTEHQSLMYDGLHVDSDFENKLTEVIGSDAYTLVIHNLTDTDVNKTYKLFYGFDTCEVNLTFVHVLHVLTNNGALCYSLEIKPTPLFGEDVNITANVSEVTHDIGRRWTRSDLNTEHQSLMYDGLHVDSDFENKLTEVIGSDAYTLVIHNLTDTDVNKTYKLFYGFDTCEVNLTFVHVLHVLTNNDQSAESNRPSKVTMIAGIIAIGTVLGFLTLLVFVKICRRKRQVDQRRMLSKIEDPHNDDLAVHEQIMV